MRLRRLRKYMSEAQREELANIGVAFQHTKLEGLLADIRALGRLPKSRTRSKDENKDSETILALRLRNLRNHMSAKQREEL